MNSREADELRAALQTAIGKVDEIQDNNHPAACTLKKYMQLQDHINWLESQVEWLSDENDNLEKRMYAAVEIAEKLADLVEELTATADKRLKVIRETRTILGANDGYPTKEHWESLQDAAVGAVMGVLRRADRAVNQSGGCY